MMTVKELVEALGTFPQDTLVMVQGYEGGFSDVGSILFRKMQLNVNKEEWDGPHEQADDGDASAVLLIRMDNPNSKVACESALRIDRSAYQSSTAPLSGKIQ
jgi:hypothetical protein